MLSAIFARHLNVRRPGGDTDLGSEGGWVFGVPSSIHPRLTPSARTWFRATMVPRDHGSERPRHVLG